MRVVTTFWSYVTRRVKQGSEPNRGDDSGRYLPSEEFFENVWPNGYDHVDVNREFKKPQ
jgi:hypothetical protein